MFENLLPGAFILASLVVLINLPEVVKRIRLYGRREKFKCQMCGNCCGFRVIPLTKEDVKRLEDGGYRDFTSHRGEPCLKRVRGKCVFYKDRCSVYEFRPKVCREFPFFKAYGIGYAQKSSFCPALEELENDKGG